MSLERASTAGSPATAGQSVEKLFAVSASALTGHEHLHYNGPVQHGIRKPKVVVELGTTAYRGIGIEDNETKLPYKGNRRCLDPNT